jgi:hypothetical protein
MLETTMPRELTAMNAHLAARGQTLEVSGLLPLRQAARLVSARTPQSTLPIGQALPYAANRGGPF